MTPVSISNKTRTLSPPADWIGDDCEPLDIVDFTTENGNFMVSLWKPSTEELEILLNGGYVHIGIRGTLFPVLSVGIEYG